MDYYNFIAQLQKILLPTFAHYDAIYNNFTLNQCIEYRYSPTNPYIHADDQLMVSIIDDVNKIRLKKIFARINDVILKLEVTIAAEIESLNSITIIQRLFNPSLKKTLTNRIKNLSFYLELLIMLNSKYNAKKIFWDNLLKEVEIIL